VPTALLNGHVLGFEHRDHFLTLLFSLTACKKILPARRAAPTLDLYGAQLTLAIIEAYGGW
jgi:hypothetical protein